MCVGGRSWSHIVKLLKSSPSQRQFNTGLLLNEKKNTNFHFFFSGINIYVKQGRIFVIQNNCLFT